MAFMHTGSQASHQHNKQSSGIQYIHLVTDISADHMVLW